MKVFSPGASKSIRNSWTYVQFCVYLPDQANFVLACQTAACPWSHLWPTCSSWSSRHCLEAQVHPNRLEIHKLMFSFVFICQVKPTLCLHVKRLLACLAHNPHTVHGVVDTAFKPEWVQIHPESMNLCSVVCSFTGSSQLHVSMSTTACLSAHYPHTVHGVLDTAFKPRWVQIHHKLMNLYVYL